MTINTAILTSDDLDQINAMVEAAKAIREISAAGRGRRLTDCGKLSRSVDVGWPAALFAAVRHTEFVRYGSDDGGSVCHVVSLDPQ